MKRSGAGTQIRTDARANLIGSLWMVAAMLFFALEDASIKAAYREIPLSEILVIFGAGGALVFAIIARFRSEKIFTPEILSPVMRIRAGFEITGRLFYALAITLTPLSSATAILQATPIVVVSGAAIFLGERVGIRRWVAIFIGLMGVLLIIQPGAESFTPLSFLAVLGMLGFAGRDLASRLAPPSIGTAVLGVYGFLAIVAAGGIYALWAREPFLWPSNGVLAAMLGVIGFGVSGYASLMRAMRIGEVSAVTPFRYSRLLFGVGLGVVLFDETLTAATLFGCALIIASGLFIMWRGQKRG